MAMGGADPGIVVDAAPSEARVLACKGRFGSGASPCVPVKLKSVSSLFSRKPRPGTTIPLPPVDSIVSVYATTLPHRSAVVRWVVDTSSEPATPAAAMSSHAA